MAQQCEMIVGFLVPHRCDNPALGSCTRCGRSYCDEHVTITPDGLLCLACQQGLDQPVSLPATAQTYDPTDLLVFSQLTAWDDETDRDTFADLS
jgi:recombinational DNA repair protein (RecF pathway)